MSKELGLTLELRVPSGACALSCLCWLEPALSWGAWLRASESWSAPGVGRD